MYDDSWCKEVDRRLSAMETRHAVDSTSKEYMDKQFNELKAEFGTFRSSVSNAVWRGIVIMTTPMVGFVALWVLKGGLASGGIN